MFENINTNGADKDEDRLGGFTVPSSDIYNAKIKMAYALMSQHGAKGIVFQFDLGNQEHEETIWVTSRTGEVTYNVKDKNGNEAKNPDGSTKKKFLPGYVTANDICLIASGKELKNQEWEDKIANVYDKEANKKIPKSVRAAVDLIGGELSIALMKVLENKSKKVGNDYVPTPETRESATIKKVFHTDSKRTVNEIEAEIEEGTFWNLWLEKNKGAVEDKRTIKDGGAGGTAGRPPAARSQPAGPPMAGGSGEVAPKRQLFGKTSS